MKKFNFNIAIILLISLFTGYVSASNDPLDIQAKNARYPSENIITAGQPTANDIKVLSSNKVSTVINLQTSGENKVFDEKTAVEGYGMSYVSIPVNGASGVTKENAKLLDKALNNNSKVFVHCKSGNRVGGLFALRAFYIQGKSVEESISIGQSHGLTSLKPIIKDKLNKEKVSSSNQ